MQISKQVALFPVIQLEKLTDLYQKLFPLTGYHVSANDQKLPGSRNIKVEKTVSCVWKAKKSAEH